MHLNASGVVAARLSFEQAYPGRSAGVRFTFLAGSVPTSADLRQAATILAAWDADGFVPGLAFATFRTFFSFPIALTVRSLDSRAPLTYQLPPGTWQHNGADAESPPLNRAISPLVHWRCLPGSNRARGRTYVPCQTELAVQAHKREFIDAAYAEQLLACFNSLPEFALRTYGLPMCLLTYQVDGVIPSDLPVSLVEVADSVSSSVARQVRREFGIGGGDSGPYSGESAT